MPNVLVLVGHPSVESFTAALADSYGLAAARAGGKVTTLLLGSLFFDPVLRHGYEHEQPLEPDLATARDALVAADHVAWFFPTWWVGPPALVKGFVERVFLPGFAFRYRGKLQSPEKLLTGRSARLVTSMDSPSFWYNLVNWRALHVAFVTGTLAFSGFAPVRTTTLYGARFMAPAARAKALASMERAAHADVQAARKRANRFPARSNAS